MLTSTQEKRKSGSVKMMCGSQKINKWPAPHTLHPMPKTSPGMRILRGYRGVVYLSSMWSRLVEPRKSERNTLLAKVLQALRTVGELLRGKVQVCFFLKPCVLSEC